MMALPAFGEVAERLRRSTVLLHSGLRGTAMSREVLPPTPRYCPETFSLGTEQQEFTGVHDLRRLLDGPGARQVRLEFLRGNYGRIRKVTLLLGGVRRPIQAA